MALPGFLKRLLVGHNPKPAPALRSRLLETSGYNQLGRGRNGYYLYNTNDLYMGEAIAKYGEYSGLEAQFLEDLCHPGDVVIEVGANIGALAMGMAQKVGPAGRVIAIEPQRLVFQNLCANVAINSLANVECHWAAAGVITGTIVAPEADPSKPANFGALSLLGVQSGSSVPLLMRDSFLSLPRLQLVKIDVEGMEVDVVSGGQRLIARHKPLLYVENNGGDKSEALMRLIDGLGYRMYWHLPSLFNPDNFYGVAENIYPNIASFNKYCVHRDAIVRNAVVEPVGIPRVTDFASHPLRRG